MRILILGAGGQVGRAVASAAPPEHEVLAVDREAVDVCDVVAVDAVFARGPFDWVVNAAAYTAVDAAEDAPERCAAINAGAVQCVASAGARSGSRLLHLSTDFVFDGNSSAAYLPSAATNPLSVYGKTKLAGEHAALTFPGNLVLRTSWVYASSGRNFVMTMIKLMRERDSIRVVRDQIGSPTWAGGLADAIWALIHAAAPAGIHHWSDDGVASWYDFAVAIQEEALSIGLLARRIQVEPIRNTEYATRAIRPAFSVLDSDATKRLIASPPTHWRESLRKMLQELQIRS